MGKQDTQNDSSTSKTLLLLKDISASEVDHDGRCT